MRADALGGGVTDATSIDASEEESDAIAPPDAPAATDANVGDSGFSIPCGPVLTCTGNTHCCAATSDNTNPFTCASTSCPDNALTLECVNESDCPPSARRGSARPTT